jgi:SAM-dependent methyltransferase
MWLQHAGVDRSADICDIGCGNGDLLVDLKLQGFRHLTGADAFIESGGVRNGIMIHKGGPAEVPGDYDLVMLNHSFEHMPHPGRQLDELKRLIRPGGTLMLRLPVAGCRAWDMYGADWVSLDPPRHLFVPSERGLVMLAERHGYDVTEIVYDSTGMQFWRSEQYRADIPLFDPQSYQVNRDASGFSKQKIAAWEREAAELNARHLGDTAAYFLRLPSHR